MTQNTPIYTNTHINKTFNVLIYILFVFICAFCVICVQNYFQDSFKQNTKFN